MNFKVMQAKMEMRRLLVVYNNREPRDRNERALAWAKLQRDKADVFMNLSYEDQIIGCATEESFFLNYFELLTSEQQNAVRLMR